MKHPEVLLCGHLGGIWCHRNSRGHHETLLNAWLTSSQACPHVPTIGNEGGMVAESNSIPIGGPIPLLLTRCTSQSMISDLDIAERHWRSLFRLHSPTWVKWWNVDA